jgi:hypothetical protein
MRVKWEYPKNYRDKALIVVVKGNFFCVTCISFGFWCGFVNFLIVL